MESFGRMVRLFRKPWCSSEILRVRAMADGEAFPEAVALK